MVREWKAKVYELHNVVFTFRTRKPLPFLPAKAAFGGIELVFGDNSDDEDPDFISFEVPPKRRNSCVERGDLEKRRGWRRANAPSSAQHSFERQMVDDGEEASGGVACTATMQGRRIREESLAVVVANGAVPMKDRGAASPTRHPRQKGEGGALSP